MNKVRSFLLVLAAALVMVACSQLTESLGLLPQTPILSEGEGNITLTFGSPGASRFVGNSYTLADVTYVTVQLTHEITGASKYEAATVTAGSAAVKFTRIPTGTWKIKANLYENSTATAEMLYWVYDKVLVKSKQDTTASLTAIPSGGLTNLSIGEAVLPTDITLNHEPVLGLTPLAAQSVEVPQGISLQLTATMVPPTSSFQKVSWSSSNPAVASVDNFGKVYTHKTGTVVISAQEAYQTGVTSALPYNLTVVPGFIGDWSMNFSGGMAGASGNSSRYIGSSKMYWRIFKDNTWEYFMEGSNSYDRPKKGTWALASGNLVFTTTQELDAITGTWTAISDNPLVTSWSLQEGGALKVDYFTTFSPSGTMDRIAFRTATSITGVKNTNTNVADFVAGTTRTLDYDDIFQFQLTAETDYDASLRKVVWGSSDSTVANFDSGSYLRISKQGTTVLRATSLDGAVTATMNLTVTAVNLPGTVLTSAWVNFTNNYEDTTKVRTNLSWMGPASSYKLESSLDNLTWITETGVSSYSGTSSADLVKPFGQKISFRITSIVNDSTHPFNFEGNSQILVVYTPESDITGNIFTPWIESVNIQDPSGDRLYVSATLGQTLSGNFYTDAAGTTTATNVQVLRYGLNTYWVYGSTTTFDGVIVKYDYAGNVVDNYPLYFTATPKIWGIIKNMDTGAFTFNSNSESIIKNFSGGTF